MGHTWKNRSHLEKWVTLGKMRHTWKNGSHLEKWVTLGKVGHNWKNGSHLEKWVTLGKLQTPNHGKLYIFKKLKDEKLRKKYLCTL